MATDWSVRRLTGEDWQLYRAVRLAMLLDEPAAYGSNFAREVAYDEERWRSLFGQAIFLAESGDGLPLGAATLLRLDPADVPEIVAMWVAGHARGRGIADALVDAAVTEAAAGGAAEVRLHVMLDNPRALAFYERSGFAFDGASGDAPRCDRMSRALS
ncbi:GNAT family N-acetyltransferase [Janibacter sp. CX7]|uniref:GNAT family N-acetyltransferase n=1 Tax=unclassified Janibacter TaxID=2649294 RepID=UPI0020CBB7ED|nr:GNAT family N-acetyltransferase [Janibacter sp. CX7]UTT65535.1 GNAT family N-acetyltransferase [Janibacter sp. CX7]